MDTSEIKQAIEQAKAQEASEGTLANIVSNAYSHHDHGLSEDQIKEKTAAAVAMIQSYVESTIELIEAAHTAAEKAGVSEQIVPIIETALSYINEEIDFIPDKLGIAGLVDDAYLVHGLIQEMSHRHRAIVGADLLPEHYFATSQRIRRLIGEPTATRLDVAIVAFARRHNVRDTIEQIIKRIGSTGMTMDLPVSVAFGDHPIEELPDLELGALGD
ncbi:MAG: YkvA family protein [Planctomycetota bacterium]